MEGETKISIAIVSNDAGGAEILSSYVKNTPGIYYLAVSGPAINIFERKLGEINNLSMEEAIDKASWLLCGTSSPSEIELNAIKRAKLLRKKSVAYLDHWINYKERFVRSAEAVYPDEIWVGDKWAKEIADKVFLNLPVCLKYNPYFDDINKALKSIESKVNENRKGVNILFLSQPISVHAKASKEDDLNRGYSEYDALTYLLSNTHVLGEQINNVEIRLHPSEKYGKYDELLLRYTNLKALVTGGEGLLASIVSSDIVVGMDSMAMFVGLLAHKKVICCIPPYGKPCRLPHSEIHYLADIIGK